MRYASSRQLASANRTVQDLYTFVGSDSLLQVKSTTARKPTRALASGLFALTTNVGRMQVNGPNRLSVHARRYNSLRHESIAMIASGPERTDSPFQFPTFDPTLIAILTVYFVQGALGIAGLTTSLFLKDELGLSPAELTALTGLFGLPWVIKPVYGFTTDNFPIFGLRRRPYLVGAGLLGALGFGALSTVVSTPTQALLAAITYNLGIAVSDVVVDSLCVERAREEAASRSGDAQDTALREQIENAAAGQLQSLCWGSREVGAIATAVASGPLLSVLSPRQVYGLTAVFPLIAATSGFLAKEPVNSASDANTTAADVSESQRYDLERFKEPFLELWNTIKQKEIYLPILVVALFRLTPSSGSGWFYFLTNSLHLGTSELGKLQILSSVASLVGIVLYRTVFAESRVSQIIAFALILSVPLGLLQLLLVTGQNQALGIPDNWLIYGDDVFLTALGQLAFMPTLTLAARLCPPGQEGTFFALLMSIYNAAGISGSEISAVLTEKLGVTSENFDMLPMLIVICNALSLAPLPLLKFLDTEENEIVEESK